MVENHRFIVVGMEHYNPLGVIRSLGQNGIRPDYIAIKYKSAVASCSKYVTTAHFVDSVEEAYEVLVSKYGQEKELKPFVITTDDDVESFLDLHYDDLKDRFIFFNSGAPGITTRYMDKKAILDLAEKHGFKVLKTIVTERGTVPKNLEYPIITKSISPNVGGWKSDVHICGSEDELRKAFEHILSPHVLIQKYIDKENELCIDGFSVDQGRSLFTPMYTTYNYNIAGYYSPYMTVHEFDLTDIGKGIGGMISEIGFEGIFEAEFLIDKDGSVYFSEINFRNSTWSYVATKLGMPIPLLWAESMISKTIPERYYTAVPDGFTAMVEPIDHKKRVLEGTTDLADWLSDYRNTDCLFYQDDQDPEPFREMVRNWERLS